MTTHSPAPEPRDAGGQAVSQWQQTWQQIHAAHFDQARERVQPVYQEHFASLRSVGLRHWHHRRDIPKDLMNLPRGLWRLSTQLVGKKKSLERPPSGKELAVALIVETQLLQLQQLQNQLTDHILTHPNLDQELLAELKQALANIDSKDRQEKLFTAINSMTFSQEGSRDLLLFLSLGLLSRSLADKAAFGSAAAIGSAAATSLYIGQQSFFGGLWVSWFGAPGWVAASGAAVGLGAAVLITPLVSPLTELTVLERKNFYIRRSIKPSTRLSKLVLISREEQDSWAPLFSWCPT
jgi:hypothetical protein